MAAQLHIAHRGEYLRGRRDGYGAALRRADYRPRGAATGTVDQQHAYSLGYGDGYAEGIDETG
jgi:hypothetical protein